MLRFPWLAGLAPAAALAVLLAAGTPAPVLLTTAAAQAQKSQAPVAKAPRRLRRGLIPDSPSERAQLLDELYAHLATAANEDVAELTSRAIEHVWLSSGSDTVDLLMERALKAINEKKLDLALKVLDGVVDLAPDYPEGWNRRAFVFYTRNDYHRSLGDLRRVLALDPNHYKALEGLGQVLRELEYKKEALGVYRRLLEVNPHMSGAKSAVDELSREVDGQQL